MTHDKRVRAELREHAARLVVVRPSADPAQHPGLQFWTLMCEAKQRDRDAARAALDRDLARRWARRLEAARALPRPRIVIALDKRKGRKGKERAPELWQCKCRGVDHAIGHGVTPMDAYADWLAKVFPGML